MRKKIIGLIALMTLCLCSTEVWAQHTLGVTAGYGLATARLKPEQEMKGLWDNFSTGLTWRYYSASRIIGGFGIDLEFLQQGFSYAMNAQKVESPSDYIYYTRRVNTLIMPIVWQPHFYMMHNRMRVFMEAAATFSYHLSSTYENEDAHKNGLPNWEGNYPFKLIRDNRWGYGLAAGAGVSFLIKQYEIHLRFRYYFGYSDIVRNRNRFADNTNDNTTQNPFRMTPLRSPMDNMMFSIGFSYRFNKQGFNEWKPRRKREKNNEVFKYAL